MKNYLFLTVVMVSLLACAGSKVAKPIEESTKTTVEKATADEVELADDAFKAGNYDKAISIYKDNINLDNASTQTLFKYAEALRISGNTPEAIRVYDKILAIDPNELNAMEGASLCYVRDGEFKKAAVLLDKILKADAARWRAINALGVIYAATGRSEEALKYYDTALKISDNNPSVLNNMGLSIAFGGDIEKGRGLIEKALNNLQASDEKKREKIDYNLALIYGISGDMDKAKAILSKYLSDAQVLNNLGFYARLAKDNKLAKSYLTKALAESPVYYEKAAKNLKAIQ